jgi:hypothetical protein
MTTTQKKKMFTVYWCASVQVWADDEKQAIQQADNHFMESSANVDLVEEVPKNEWKCSVVANKRRY